MNSVFIYALKSPTTGEIRYVGKTMNLSARFSKHLSDTRINHRTNWIRSLTSIGLKPVVEILDEVPEEFWPQWEVAWIDYFREQGFDLTNANAGGEGGHSPSKETRAKKSAALLGKRRPPFSEEWRKKLSIAGLGRKHSEETRQKIGVANLGRQCAESNREKLRIFRTGKKMPQETRLKIGLAQKGVKKGPMAEEIKAKLRAIQLGRKPSEETRAKMREAAKRRKKGTV